jgi:hypothetical protein
MNYEISTEICSSLKEILPSVINQIILQFHVTVPLSILQEQLKLKEIECTQWNFSLEKLFITAAEHQDIDLVRALLSETARDLLPLRFDHNSVTISAAKIFFDHDWIWPVDNILADMCITKFYIRGPLACKIRPIIFSAVKLNCMKFLSNPTVLWYVVNECAHPYTQQDSTTFHMINEFIFGYVLEQWGLTLDELVKITKCEIDRDDERDRLVDDIYQCITQDNKHRSHDFPFEYSLYYDKGHCNIRKQCDRCLVCGFHESEYYAKLEIIDHKYDTEYHLNCQCVISKNALKFINMFFTSNRRQLHKTLVSRLNKKKQSEREIVCGSRKSRKSRYQPPDFPKTESGRSDRSMNWRQ